MFAKNLWDKLANHKLVQSISDNYNKIKHTIQNKYSITPLIDRIYHIDYPQKHHLKTLSAHIGQQKYQLWNLSEYSYEKQFCEQLLLMCPRGQLKHLCYEFYTNSPFLELLQAIEQIHTFLSTNKQGKVYLHCQQSRIRSAVFLSCYIYRHKCQNISCISDAIVRVNKQLNVSLQSNNMNEGKAKYANHHLLIRNFINYQTNPKFINQYQMQLKRIVLANPPHIRRQKDKSDLVGWQQAKVHAELRCGQQLVWKGIAQKIDDTLVFALKVDVSDEFLIVVKYAIGKQVYRMLRIQLNSNFIFEENATIQQNNIDLSPYVATPQKVIQIKLHFSKLKDLSKLALKAAEKQTKKQQLKVQQQNKPEVKQQANQHKFAVQSHEEVQQADEDLQTRIEQVMREMEQRKLRQQAENEEIEDSDEEENEQQGFEVLQMSEENSPKTISSKEQHKSLDNWNIQLNNHQQPVLTAATITNKPQAITTHQPNKLQQPQSEEQQDLQDYLKRLESQAV